ncbi:MAG TPA: class I lanthipeptide [Candidatus Deferrimicrobium sp.]|nr:class I lanthipeptide [Candidatus Deferrimicrobium sp.]
MKQKKNGKLSINKVTIGNLNQIELENIKAGMYDPCWENAWTAYYCSVMYTGDREDTQVSTVPGC